MPNKLQQAAVKRRKAAAAQKPPSEVVPEEDASAKVRKLLLDPKYDPDFDGYLDRPSDGEHHVDFSYIEYY